MKKKGIKKLRLKTETIVRLDKVRGRDDDDVVDPSVVITCFPYSFWCATAGCGA